jgi:hypothetical protein
MMNKILKCSFNNLVNSLISMSIVPYIFSDFKRGNYISGYERLGVFMMLCISVHENKINFSYV